MAAAVVEKQIKACPNEWPGKRVDQLPVAVMCMPTKHSVYFHHVNTTVVQLSTPCPFGLLKVFIELYLFYSMQVH